MSYQYPHDKKVTPEFLKEIEKQRQNNQQPPIMRFYMDCSDIYAVCCSKLNVTNGIKKLTRKTENEVQITWKSFPSSDELNLFKAIETFSRSTYKEEDCYLFNAVHCYEHTELRAV